MFSFDDELALHPQNFTLPPPPPHQQQQQHHPHRQHHLHDTNGMNGDDEEDDLVQEGLRLGEVDGSFRNYTYSQQLQQQQPYHQPHSNTSRGFSNAAATRVPKLPLERKVSSETASIG